MALTRWQNGVKKIVRVLAVEADNCLSNCAPAPYAPHHPIANEGENHKEVQVEIKRGQHVLYKCCLISVGGHNSKRKKSVELSNLSCWSEEHF